tara:strand:- start:2510 stop:3205 length:696 start_codon:yes stop_codon:yes gene_type:complete
MSGNGWFRMHRGWLKNPALKNNDYKVLWLYLIESVAFTDLTIDRFGCPVSINRGQYMTSLRRLSLDVNMSIRSLRTALKTFVNHGMIDLKTDTGTTLVTICNYSIYQDSFEKATQERHRSDTQKKEGKEIKENKSDKLWKIFIDSYPQGVLDSGKPRRWPKSGRDSARKIFDEVVKDVTAEQLVECAKNYALSGEKFIYNPKKWLQSDGWKDWIESAKKKNFWEDGFENRI